MKDYHKVCWYCGKAAMKPVDTWYQCKECGATYVDPTPLALSDIELGHRNIYDQDHYKVTESLTPSKKATREAAKARAKKAAVV